MHTMCSDFLMKTGFLGFASEQKQQLETKHFWREPEVVVK